MNRSDLKDHGISALFGAVSTVSTMAAVFGGAAVVFGGAAVVFAGATAANFYDKDIPQSFACSGATFEINDDGNTVTPKLPAGCTMAPK